MKKLLIAFLALVTMFGCASAEIDLSGMTYDELVALKDQINLAMWQCEEWEEVTVPQGIWQVGVDIPAGHWTVKCAPGWRNTQVDWGQSLSSSGSSIAWSGRYSTYNSIYNPDHKYYEIGDGITEYDFEVRNGDYIIIDDGSCVFTPYSGKQALGFKALSKPESSQTKTNQNSQPNKTESPKNSEYQPFDYKTYARNPENYINQKYELNGEIIQVIGNREDGYGIRLSTDDYNDEVVWVKISFDPGYSLLDGDVATICAKANNMYTYETIFGATLTIPYFIADSIEILE